MNNNWTTRHSLIERLKDSGDNLAWDEFLQLYRPFIKFLLNKMTINQTDRKDLSQEILLKLHQNLPSYTKQNAKFRSWLGKVITNTARTYVKQLNRNSEKKHEISTTLQAITDSNESDAEIKIQEEWQTYLLEKALTRLESVFSEKVINCFTLTLQGVPLEQISAELNVKCDTVYMIRSRMKKRLMSEMQLLIRELEF